MAVTCCIFGNQMIGAFLWLFIAVFVKESFSEPVHLMSVTPTPFGATQPGTSFSCLLSEPDTDKLDKITIKRLVRRGNNNPYDIDTLPAKTSYNNNAALNKRTADLPDTKGAQGVFYCRASDNQEVPTTVPVTIMDRNRNFEPSDGQFTVTVNANEAVTLNVTILANPSNRDLSTGVRWQKQDRGFQTWVSIPSRIVNSGSNSLFIINRATAYDMGVYATYWTGLRTDFEFSLIRLIVRECASGKWGPPSCASICESCYNGGICDAKTGKCVCRPGFTGPNCLTVCGEDTFGWNCDHRCGTNAAIATCSGSLFCMPDPVGCSCMTGWMGTECNQACPDGKFGAGCTETCQCSEDVPCNIFTGECPEDCPSGWSGPGCQIPDVCLDVYYGVNCTEKCHCLDGASCDNYTGRCDPDSVTGLSLCEPGYVSSTGINQDNCQQYEGCFADCTKTCHCQGGVDSCNVDTGVCTPDPDGNICKDGWTGISCQTGIVYLTYKKANPDQPVIVTCIVTGDPDVPSESDVELLISSDENGRSYGTQVDATVEGNYLTVTHEAYPQEGNQVVCQVKEGDTSVSAQAQITPEFYDLPKLFQQPLVKDFNTTSVNIQWKAWDPEVINAGDGPVIGYQIYYKLKSNASGMVGGFVPNTNKIIYEGTIVLLEPGTEYLIQVSAVREGPGGAGEPSPEVSVTTVAITTLPPASTQGTDEPSPEVNVTTATTVANTTLPAASTEGTNGPSPKENVTTVAITTIPHASAHGTGESSPKVNGTSVAMTTLPPASTQGTVEPSPRVNVSPVVITTLPPKSTSQVSDVTLTTRSVGRVTPDDRVQQLTSVIVALVIVLLVICIFIIAVSCIRWWKKKKMNRYSPSVVVSDADLDRLSQVLVLDAKSVTALNNPGFKEESTDELAVKAPAETIIPMVVLSSPALQKETENENSSIKRRLQIAPVDVKDFGGYMKTKRQTSDMKVEWESLPEGLVKPTAVAKDPGNKGKNRYRNVVAYDHSRVSLIPLKNDLNSDYINACFIKGIKDQYAYIATQGPSKKTVNDFWRMIWQKKVTVVVMACNLVEERKDKCSQYWPELNAAVTFGEISVTLNGEENKGDEYTIRRLTVSKDGEKGSRNVTQLHFTIWPDKNVPKHCTPVIKFIKDIRKHQTGNSPLLVHCSAGAGRTGTILAIHAMMNLADTTKQVDIYNFIFSMRNNRPYMVQTASQYIFVHDAMLEYLFCKDSYIETGEFASRLKSMKETNPETGKTHLEDEFEILGLISPIYGAKKTRGSLSQDGLNKLRSGDSIPVDSSRPLLMTSREDGDMSNYVNAAFMNGYKKKDMFISTQMPLSNTVVDLWRLVYDYDCTCIVQLNSMDHDDCAQFWPDEGDAEYGPFKVTLINKESQQDFEVRTLQLAHTKMTLKSPISVCHFQYTTWPKDDERPATSQGMLQLISAVERWQKSVEKPGPLVVLCMNAAGRTGAFCTIQTCLDQARIEDGVDILQNVKQLRIHRTNMVDTPAKYLFCYDTVNAYLKTLDTNDPSESYQNTIISGKIEDSSEEPTAIYGNIPAVRAPINKRENPHVPSATPRSEGQKQAPVDERVENKNIYDNIPINGAPKKDKKSKINQKASKQTGSKITQWNSNGRPTVKRSEDADDKAQSVYENVPFTGKQKKEQKEKKKKGLQ